MLDTSCPCRGGGGVYSHLPRTQKRKIPDQMFCTKCGSQISPDVVICPMCGQSLAAAASATVPPAAWTPPMGVQSQTGRWMGEGWRMVKADMGNYVLLALVFMVLNGTRPSILPGPLLAGFHRFCIQKTLKQ